MEAVTRLRLGTSQACQGGRRGQRGGLSRATAPALVAAHRRKWEGVGMRCLQKAARMGVNQGWVLERSTCKSKEGMRVEGLASLRQLQMRLWVVVGRVHSATAASVVACRPANLCQASNSSCRASPIQVRVRVCACVCVYVFPCALKCVRGAGFKGVEMVWWREGS